MRKAYCDRRARQSALNTVEYLGRADFSRYRLGEGEPYFNKLQILNETANNEKQYPYQ